jgi:sugar/nucleoside kinase (ribokinase family)
MSRLVSVGNVVIDLVTTVPRLPERGADMLATGATMAAGGGFNAMVAASRQGLVTVYAGGHGTGYFGELARSALAEAGIEVLLARDPQRDSGYDIALVDDGGERTFVTVFGAEAHLMADQLGSLALVADDYVLVSGYGLLDATNGAVLAPWIAELEERHVVLVDPGPLAGDIPPAIWAAVAGRADWISCNERESGILTGIDDPQRAVVSLAGSGSAIVRLGADGCLLCADGTVEHIAGFPVEVVDTNGAGDAHTGTFLAALAEGLNPADATRRANAAAAIAVTRAGPATSPTRAEVLALLAP